MDAAAAVLSSPAGRPFTSPLTTTPAWPFPACCPIRKPTPPSPSCAPPWLSMPSTVSPFAACSPTTDTVIARICSVPPVPSSASVTTSPAPTLPAPTAKPNASFKPPCASGPTSATTSTQKKEISSSRPGSSTTTSTARMVVSVTLRPSAAHLRWVQRLDRSQLAPDCDFELFTTPVANSVAAMARNRCARRIDSPYFPDTRNQKQNLYHRGHRVHSVHRVKL